MNARTRATRIGSVLGVLVALLTSVPARADVPPNNADWHTPRVRILDRVGEIVYVEDPPCDWEVCPLVPATSFLVRIKRCERVGHSFATLRLNGVTYGDYARDPSVFCHNRRATQGYPFVLQNAESGRGCLLVKVFGRNGGLIATRTFKVRVVAPA